MGLTENCIFSFPFVYGSELLDHIRNSTLLLKPQPGDVILRAPHKRKATQKKVISWQVPRSKDTGDTYDEHTCWTHVGVFVNSTEICDSMPGKGVLIRPFEDFVAEATDYHFRVRRPTPLNFTSDELEKCQSLVESEAKRLVGVPYSRIGAVISGLANQVGKNSKSAGDVKANQCANTAAHILFKAFNMKVWHKLKHSYPVPATFSLCIHFKDVDIVPVVRSLPTNSQSTGMSRPPKGM